MFKIDEANFAAGRHAYLSGVGVDGIANMVQANYEAAHSAKGNEESRLYERMGKSLMLGYLDGLIIDVRKIAASIRPPGARA